MDAGRGVKFILCETTGAGSGLRRGGDTFTACSWSTEGQVPWSQTSRRPQSNYFGSRIQMLEKLSTPPYFRWPLISLPHITHTSRITSPDQPSDLLGLPGDWWCHVFCPLQPGPSGHPHGTLEFLCLHGVGFPPSEVFQGDPLQVPVTPSFPRSWQLGCIPVAVGGFSLEAWTGVPRSHDGVSPQPMAALAATPVPHCGGHPAAM